MNGPLVARGQAPRNKWAFGAVLLIVLGALFGWSAGPVSAHAEQLDIDPPAGAILETTPDEVVVTFNEPISLSGGTAEVFDDSGESVPVEASVTDASVHIDLPATLDDGTYLVAWRIISQDSHPLSGTSTFSIGTPSAGGAAEVDLGGGTPAAASLWRVLAMAGTYGRRPRGGRTVVVLAPVAPRRAPATRRFDGRRAAAPRPVGYGRGARRHRVAGHRLSGPARHGRRIVGRAHRRIVRQRHDHRPDRPGNDAVARRVARPADLPVDRSVVADTDRRAREFTAGPRRLRARRAHPHEGADEGDRRRRHRSHRGGCCMARRRAGVGDHAPPDRGGVAGPGRARRVMGRALRRRCGVGRRDHDERDRAAVVQRPRRHRVRAGVDGEDRTGVGAPGDRREEPARARPGDRGGGGVG